MNELFLYDRDKGLFKAVLQQSTVMQGRYFVVKAGMDINTNNLDQYFTEVGIGTVNPDQIYPCVICPPPSSTLLPPSFTNEQLQFTLFFLTRSNYTGQNQVKDPDAGTQASTHLPWYDWKDMKECAANFVRQLMAVLKTKYVEVGGVLRPLKGLITVGQSSINISRISELGTDTLNGIRLSFWVDMNEGCEINDYPQDALQAITIPDLNIHPLHKH